MRKRGQKSRSFIMNSRNLLIALLILASAVAVYSQAQGAVVSHTPAQISPQGAGSGLDADTLQKLSSANILASAAATSVVDTLPTCDASKKGKMAFVNSQDRLYLCTSTGWKSSEAGTVSVQPTRPTCGVNNIGQIVFVVAVDSAYFCSGGGWKSLEPTTDPDSDSDNVVSMASGGTDCNDADATRWQLLSGYPDLDLDTYTLATAVNVCSGASLPTGYRSAASTPADCNDADNARWEMLPFYPDLDLDTYTLANAVNVCVGRWLPANYLSAVSSPLDCDDNDNTKYPGNNLVGRNYVLDRKDNNCDGRIDEDFIVSSDTYAHPGKTGVCEGREAAIAIQPTSVIKWCQEMGYDESSSYDTSYSDQLDATWDTDYGGYWRCLDSTAHVHNLICRIRYHP